MNVHEMTIEQLLNVEVASVEFGRQLAEEILQEQLTIHRQMIGLYDNAKWQKLSDRHYDLRKIRRAVLHLTGKMAIEQKRTVKR
ncbi:MAG TPA: hypothetical protein VIH90_07430 [Candidatus Saccharimonadales bacterium]